MSTQKAAIPIGQRLAAWIAGETEYLHRASTGSSCDEVRQMVFHRLGEAIERNGAATTAISGVLEGLENEQQHRGAPVKP